MSLRDEVKYGTTYNKTAENQSSDSILYVLKRDAYELFSYTFDKPEFSKIGKISWEKWEDVPYIDGGSLWREVDLKRYELKDHLGNVRVIVSDLRHAKLDKGVPTDFTALIKHYSNYYPFGMEKPSMVWDKGGYRYGFNGKENDDELKGIGNHQDYGMRVYDPRLAKFLSVDPLSKSYPWYTPYQFAGNKPIEAIDLDGLEEVMVVHCFFYNQPRPKLKPTEWYVVAGCMVNGLGARASISIDEVSYSQAAVYNTSKGNYNAYTPVAGIHQYYIWAASAIDKKTGGNIKFYHAARDVTSIKGVGGAYSFPMVAGLSPAGVKSLEDVNVRLLKENMPVIDQLITWGYSDAVDGSGVMWDMNYVNREQTFLTEEITKNPLSKSDRDAINNNFKQFEAIHPEYTLAKSLLDVNQLDYQPQDQRMAIGRSMVFMAHMQRKGFEGSKEYNEVIDYFKCTYGEKNTQNFLDTYKKIGK